MTGFGGRAFEFLGQPNKVYSLLSEKFHKVDALPNTTRKILVTRLCKDSFNQSLAGPQRL